MKFAGKETIQANRKERQPVQSPTPKRNDPCPFGSGKKYKKCCGAVTL
ncbi:uncharacterized protein YecA (UPF0149 family) [Virgibacillus natechei]|uniref:Uncharacterized protein YecA (UPF0149 family) n=1 Tax=Virgibacillus natechei TaxID=1216297 RepID=A0ABS4ILC2_9BACI|nr:SEC-C metal-binding domain-containing protein [Virgibacillus natechei]MBP1971746.1 uncharacterized protein YecA (UPF0149 family) [Virgibacillus natechei]UZD12906.1 SEC-C metal-binding domain-containing protein [Virgibacillus natechei]